MKRAAIRMSIEYLEDILKIDHETQIVNILYNPTTHTADIYVLTMQDEVLDVAECAHCASYPLVQFQIKPPEELCEKYNKMFQPY